MYSLVIGVLAFVTLLIIFGAMKLSKLTQGIYIADSDEYQAAVVERIHPFGQVYMPGEEASAGEPIVAEAAQPDPVETRMSGPQVFNDACLVCHGAGVGGAPIKGNAEAWAPRIGKGKDTLYQHALEGFTGEVGFMPARGARMDLSDDEIKSAVDYMVSEAGGN